MGLCTIRTCEAICSGCAFLFLWASKVNVCHWICTVVFLWYGEYYLFSDRVYIPHHKSGWDVRDLITVQSGLLWVLSVRISLDRGRLNILILQKEDQGMLIWNLFSKRNQACRSQIFNSICVPRGNSTL